MQPWQNKHLDLETEEFRETPSTGENIVQMLWPKLDAKLDGRVMRVRLAETANNRFTLRRTEPLNRILITGASRGIGRAIAENLAARGANAAAARARSKRSRGNNSRR